MLKMMLISFVLFLLFLSCQNINVVEPFNFERDTPEWLKTKIDTMSNHTDYYGTSVFRYEWNEDFIYHIMIPISSCAFCELYYENGNRTNIVSDVLFTDFVNNRKNETLVWERDKW